MHGKPSFTWTLTGRGWAACTVADDRARAEAVASFLTRAPEDLLTAVARLVLGEPETRARFEAEPVAFQWIFNREAGDARIRLLRDDAEIWTGRTTVTALARAVIRAFDAVAHTYGESEYHAEWGSRFPRTELEALRSVWRAA
jgi:hypothetical protein